MSGPQNPCSRCNGSGSEPGTGVAPQGLRERVDYALSESIDCCARCKICDNQVDAVMAVLADAAAAAVAAERHRILRRIAAECHRRKWRTAPGPDPDADDPAFNALHHLGNEILSGKILDDTSPGVTP